jgi:hypothetical protein
MLANSVLVLQSGRTALKAVCQSHETVRVRLAIAEVGTLFYRHTCRVGIAGPEEQWVTINAIVSVKTKKINRRYISIA